jgi:hypothetical protein
MSSGITRISDLPDLPESFIGSSQPLNDQSMQNTYAPINAHPNPYGNSQNPNASPPPLPQPSYNAMNVPMPNNLTPEQQNSLQNIPQQRLPSRDIKINSTSYTQDEEIKPNYIPKKKRVKFDDEDEYEEDEEDYVEKHEKINKKKVEKHQQEKHRTKLIDFILTEIQIPIFVSVLFLIFQMNFIKILMIKYLNFLPLYNNDGNLNFNGILLKSAFFGILFYCICKFTNYISEV